MPSVLVTMVQSPIGAAAWGAGRGTHESRHAPEQAAAVARLYRVIPFESANMVPSCLFGWPVTPPGLGGGTILTFAAAAANPRRFAPGTGNGLRTAYCQNSFCASAQRGLPSNR